MLFGKLTKKNSRLSTIKSILKFKIQVRFEAHYFYLNIEKGESVYIYIVYIAYNHNISIYICQFYFCNLLIY